MKIRVDYGWADWRLFAVLPTVMLDFNPPCMGTMITIHIEFMYAYFIISFERKI